MADSKEIAVVETVFEEKDSPETFFFACSCAVDPKLSSGCKGKVCEYVAIALIQAGKITTRAADRRLSGFHHQKKKQNA